MTLPEILDCDAERCLTADDGPMAGCDDAPQSISGEQWVPFAELMPETPLAAPNGKSEAQWMRAQMRLSLIEAYHTLLQKNSGKAAAEAMHAAGMQGSRARYIQWLAAYKLNGFAGLFDNANNSGRKRKYDLTNKVMGALKGGRLTSNRTRTDGSTPEAVRIAMRRGQIDAELGAELLQRQREGKEIVPRSIHRELVAGRAVTKQHRNPTDAALDYLSSDGSLMWLTDPQTGRRRPVQVGDILEADDATVNFPVCIPWEMGGDPCSEEFGVRVARFQWLVAIDRRSRFVPGYRYTARPKSSYRAVDINGLFHRIFQQHGVWKRLCLERATWESDKVNAMMRALRIERITAYSPHQKPFIEGLFNLIWTKLSDMPGQVGRYRGEEEATNSILTSCQKGATDPRKHFPMLGDACAAFDRALAERNSQVVQSKHWGRWVPEERWLASQAEARAHGRLRTLPSEAAWVFAPEMREWTVRSSGAKGTVQLAEGWSVEYCYQAPWLTEFNGCRVRVHFDPFDPKGEATIVLAQRHNQHNENSVLGTAVQTNVTASEACLALGYADLKDFGVKMRREQAIEMRAETRTIKAGGKMGLTVSEARSAQGGAIVVRDATDAPALPVAMGPETRTDLRLAERLTPPPRAKNIFASRSEAETRQQSDRISELLAAAQG